MGSNWPSEDVFLSYELEPLSLAAYDLKLLCFLFCSVLRRSDDQIYDISSCRRKVPGFETEDLGSVELSNMESNS